MNIVWEIPGHSRDGVIDTEILKTPLPADRHFDEAGATYGDCRDAVMDLLARPSFLDVLCRSTTFQADGITTATVAILKHGHFYHPAKLTLENASGDKALFVINLAVTDEAMGCIAREFAVFKKLSGKSSAVPRMDTLETIEVNGRSLMAMVGHWLEGYWEFHQTEENGKREVVVWADPEHRYLSREKSLSIYRDTSEILSRLYNPETFEAVQPWHHAAGDFVVSLSGETPDVKLISLRQYTPMVDIEEAEPEDYLEAALFFLMLHSIRNRLDRLDGIGEVAWVGDGVVAATLDGVLAGFSCHEDVGPFEGPFDTWVRIYLKKQAGDDLLQCAASVVGSLNPGASEMALIREEIGGHIAELMTSIERVF